MIAFVQPYDVQGAGGGSRILRALLAGEHPPVVGINTGLTAGPVGAAIEEVHIPTRPGLGRRLGHDGRQYTCVDRTPYTNSPSAARSRLATACQSPPVIMNRAYA